MALTPGEKDLHKLIATMKPDLSEAKYVFATIPSSQSVPPDVDAQMTFREAEGLTIITTLDSAQAHNLEYTFPCRMITLKVHSNLEAVGFLAAITHRLKEEGLACNPVSGFYHDHLFVPEEKAEKALDVLLDLVDESDLQGNKMIRGFQNFVGHLFGVGGSDDTEEQRR